LLSNGCYSWVALVMGRTRWERRWPCFFLGCGVLHCLLKGLRRAVESLGMFELRTSGLRDRHPCHDFVCFWLVEMNKT
jgi:hypothetical protein